MDTRPSQVWFGLLALGAPLHAQERPRLPIEIKGRCVRAADGAALAGCKVTLSSYLAERPAPRLGGQPLPGPPRPVQTDADGRFVLRFLPRLGDFLRLEIHAPGMHPRTAIWNGLAPGTKIDCGDVRMSPGRMLRGRVVDRRGKPLPGVAGVTLRGLALPLGRGPGESAALARTQRGARDWMVVDAAADGSFELGPVPIGTHALAVAHKTTRLLSAKRVEVRVDGALPPLLVCLDGVRLVAGRVLGGDGQPAAGVRLHALCGSSGSSMATTDAAGRFVLYGSGGGLDQKVSFLIRDSAGHALPHGAIGAARWGDRQVELRLGRAYQMELEVVDAESGAAVEDFALRCFWWGGDRRSWTGTTTELLLRHEGGHPGGKLRLTRVLPGSNRLRVVPLSPRYLVSDLLAVHCPADGPPKPMRVALRRAAARIVVVRDFRGEPRVGQTVELIRPGAQALTPQTRVHDPRLRSPSTIPFPQAVLVDKAVTDAAGRCQLHGPPHESGLSLRLPFGGKRPGRRGRRAEAYIRNGLPDPRKAGKLEIQLTSR